MIPRPPMLLPWVHDLRPSGIRRGQVVTFRPLPLYLVLMCYVDEVGVEDRPETEPEVLAHLGADLQLRELVSLSWWDIENGPCSTSIIMAHTPEEGLLVLGGESEYIVVGLGPERDLQAVLAAHAELVLPRLASRGAVLREVSVRSHVCWTADDLQRIVAAIAGVEPPQDVVRRPDLLTVVDEE